MFSKTYAFENLIDFDNAGNMYIMDGYEGAISVFDSSFRLIKTFGRTGQGPKEFERPSALVIMHNKVYVFHGFYLYKIVDLDGNYISSGTVFFENPMKFSRVKDDFYLLRGKTDRTFTGLELILSAVDSETFVEKNELFRYKYPPGLRGPSYDFRFDNWLLALDNGEFFFPEDNLRKYSIIRYSMKGRPVLAFGRDYERREYSKAARDRFYATYERSIKRGEVEFPKYPPAIVKMFRDDMSNLWVITGETYEDNGNEEYENSIDIFNDKGEWLFAFKSKVLSRNCFYHDGKIFKVLPINLIKFNQAIEVFRIHYVLPQ